MEMTLDEALQQGIKAHKEGKLQDAERLYRAILQVQPDHPDANHNLGVLAVAVGKPLEAMPLFKLALGANPQIEQFWLSYIDVLIRLERFRDVEQILADAQKAGVSSGKLDVIHQQIQTSLLKDKVSAAVPAQEQIDSLLAYYQSSRLAEFEELAISMTEQFPAYNIGWKALAVALKQTGRLHESLLPMQKSVELAPQDAEAHSNLGSTLNEIGRLDEAETSLRQAIALKPDYAEAHSNLGSTLRELGRLDDAEASYRQAIAVKPDFAEAHSNLGVTLKALGRLDDAEASYRQATALKPDFAEAHGNLGNTLEALGRLDEAETSLRQAIALKSDYAEAHNRLLKCLYQLNKQSLFFDQLDYLINENTANATIGSLTCRSALKYGVEKPNLFCREPLHYISHIDMNTQYDFEETFVETARLILNDNKISNRKQSLLVNGYQTFGNLFDIKNSVTEKIQRSIRLEIEKYRVRFENSEEGLIKKWPPEYSLYGWLISMKSGGELKPHIHEKGWLSGSVYINVPPKSKTESGSLVVSLGEEEDATDGRINVEKIINVVTGSLVLFPASLTHYTIPFEAEDERIVLAFDVKQK